MSWIDKKDENFDGKRLEIAEAFDIIEAARMKYGLDSEQADVIEECVGQFRDGCADVGDMMELLELQKDLLSDTLRGRMNLAVRAIGRLAEM